MSKKPIIDESLGVRKSSNIMTSDAQNGREMEELLHTIHRSVIEEIILGTIGYRWMTDPDFKRCFYKKDSCSGIYIITFTRKSTQPDQIGRSLTREEWALIKEMIERLVRFSRLMSSG